MGDLNNTDHLECPEMFDFNTLSGVFFILVFILSLIANVLLVCVVVIYEKVKNVTNVFILNLACADLLFTITLPFWAVYTCTTGSLVISPWVLHNWPCNPVRRQRCAKVFCAAAWIISIAASVSDAIKVKVVDWGIMALGVRRNLMKLMSTWQIIFKCYCSSSSHLPQTEKGTGLENFSMAFEIFRILAFSHCCMNPLLYMLSQKFRRHLMQLLRCNKPTRYITKRGNGRSTSIFQNLAFRTQSSTVMSEVPSN
uniref:G-protein coupled receptors family 1 profile domain-containing protein n=1 Tax=Labrus bergylta TaxID=56723 RepID=A0A3Q3MN94_9LABR